MTRNGPRIILAKKEHPYQNLGTFVLEKKIKKKSKNKKTPVRRQKSYVQNYT